MRPRSCRLSSLMPSTAERFGGASGGVASRSAGDTCVGGASAGAGSRSAGETCVGVEDITEFIAMFTNLIDIDNCIVDTGENPDLFFMNCSNYRPSRHAAVQ